MTFMDFPEITEFYKDIDTKFDKFLWLFGLVNLLARNALIWQKIRTNNLWENSCFTNVPTTNFKFAYSFQMTQRIVVVLLWLCLTPFQPHLLWGKLQAPLFMSNRDWGGMWPRLHGLLTSMSALLSMTHCMWNSNGLRLETTSTKEEVIIISVL